WTLLQSFFSFGFWRTIFGLSFTLLSFGLLIWFFERKKNPGQFGGPAHRGIGSAFWWSAVTMTTVGYGDKTPVTFMGRFVALIWMFSGLILISGFTAAIASSLTVDKIEGSIHGLEDMYGLNVAALSNSTGEQYLLDNGFKPILVDSISSGLGLLKKGKVDVLIHDLPVLKYYHDEEGLYGKKLGILEEAPHQSYAFALNPESTRREDVNRVILELLESPGWSARLYKYLGRRP
ncbi:MAG: transporter substrate-binding domain-containing protein, partial [Planctomycetes bacterium]|nr:transporter substrate-binding domain-containing protein [Planctomycetota bacterium]